MKKIKLIAFTAAVAVLLTTANAATASIAADELQPTASALQLSAIASTPGTVLSIEQAVSLNSRSDVDVKFTSTELTFGGVQYTVNLGTAVLGNKSEAIQEFLSDLESVRSELNSNANLAGAAEVLALESSVSQTAMPVTEIVIAGEVPISVAKSSFVMPKATQPVQPVNADIGIRAAASCGNWTPNFINSLSGPHPVSGRTERITFSWSAAALTALKCTGSTAFEPDFVTYNYDGLSYLGDTFISSTSNFPSSYLDTRFLDNPQEHVYTVGNSDNSKLVSNFTYSNYVHTNNGNSATDKAKIVWQRSHYFGACLPSAIAYCIYADASSIILAWLITMPGSY